MDLLIQLKDWLKKNKVSLLILTVLVAIAYFNSLGNGFVSDDRGIAYDSKAWTFQTLFSQPHSYLRTFLTYLLFPVVLGRNPIFYHLLNFFLHLGNVYLVFALVGLILKPKYALPAAALFAVHPLSTEAVTWVSGGGYIQYSFFFLISFITYILSKKEKHLYYVSLIAYLLSQLSSDKAAPLFLVFFLYEFTFGSIRKNWKKLLPFTLTSTFFIIHYAFNVGGRVNSVLAEAGDAPRTANLHNLLIQLPIAIGSYVLLFFWPQNLSLYQTELLYFPPVVYIFKLLLLLTLLGLIIWGYFKNRQVFFWLSFLFISLGVTLLPLPIAWVVAERYIYLGSLGLIVPLAIVFRKLLARGRFRTISYVVFALIISLLAIRTVIRNMDWKNEDSLWLSMAKTSPSSQTNHNNLGDYYDRQGDYQKAIEEFKTAIRLNPRYADAYNNLGTAYHHAGNDTEALKSYQKALELNPKIWQSYQGLGGIYYSENNLPKALENLEKASELAPREVEILFNTAYIYSLLGNNQRALAIAANILSIDPNHQKTKELIASLRSK